MAGGNFYIRYGSLKKLKNLLGEILLIDVSKGLFIMQDKIHSYDEASITIRESVQDKQHSFEWGTGYYENARRKLSVSPSQEDRETFLKNTSKNATNAPPTLESKKHLNAVFRLHPNFRPVYSYIRQHPSCKANDISLKTHNPHKQPQQHPQTTQRRGPHRIRRQQKDWRVQGYTYFFFTKSTTNPGNRKHNNRKK